MVDGDRSGRPAIERSIAMPMGVVLERRAIDHPWQKCRWLPVGVIPGAPPVERWKELARGEGFVRWHAATFRLELHRKETEAYRTNLSSATPAVYVVLRRASAPFAEPGAFRVFAVTASPYEAQDFLDPGEDIVEGVPMPPGVIAWVQGFVDRHHVDEPFKKRKRDRLDPESLGRPDRVGRPPGRRRGRHDRA